MSKCDTTEIKCKYCGEIGTFRYWGSVNTVLNPELKQAVRTGELFKYECPKCKKTSMVHYEFLYHQMEDSFIIFHAENREHAQLWLNSLNESMNHEKMGDLFKATSGKYVFRAVDTLHKLNEKVAIFEAGLDDRVIEVAKIIAMASFMRSNPEDDIDDVYFAFGDDSKKVLVFLNEETPVASAELSDSIYDYVKATYIDTRPSIQEDDRIIDSEWACKVMEEHFGDE
ncbi:MAG: CpXC domain-containing protein [Lachnospiraceae bacterium]|nr:CpXC domain-containing protein [Lachnospiraceae bacterium]